MLRVTSSRLIICFPAAIGVVFFQMTVADFGLYGAMGYADVEFKADRPTSDWFQRWLESFESDKKMSEYLRQRDSSRFGT